MMFVFFSVWGICRDVFDKDGSASGSGPSENIYNMWTEFVDVAWKHFTFVSRWICNFIFRNCLFYMYVKVAVDIFMIGSLFIYMAFFIICQLL